MTAIVSETEATEEALTAEIISTDDQSPTITMTTASVTPVVICAKQQQLSGTYIEPDHSKAIEQLVALKAILRDADMDIFWTHLTRGLTTICHAQGAFVAKRITTTEVAALPVEMSHCETKSPFSVSGLAAYYNDGHSIEHNEPSHGISSEIPSRLIEHDTTLLVSEKLDSYLGESMDKLPFPMEACLIVPLFLSGEYFAHLGLLWTSKALEQHRVFWPYKEMILHSLEDSIYLRMTINGPPLTSKKLLGDSIYRSRSRSRSRSRGRNAAINANPEPSYKLHARSISHELYTPMHGVLGMLDNIYATVEQSMIEQKESAMLATFQSLRDNIELIQDSARRAIHAADNIVLAYDLNMQVPETPSSSVAEDSPYTPLEPSETRTYNVKKKRPRSVHEDYSRPSSDGRGVKSQRTDTSPTVEVKTAVEESGKIVHTTTPPQDKMEEVLIKEVAQEAVDTTGHPQTLSAVIRPTPVFPPMVLQQTKVRITLCSVIKESLHVGGRPDSCLIEQTSNGERITVSSRSPSGEVSSTQSIEWSVDSCVPELLYVNEKDFAKMVSCVFLNALKFTETGEISIRAALNDASRYVTICIEDTGTGIPERFIPNLFKAFAREDGSTTRGKEGLGLGLLVGKGLARKLGGDLLCVRSAISGPKRGSEFEIRLPISPNEIVSRPNSPHPTSPSSIHHSDSSSTSRSPNNYRSTVIASPLGDENGVDSPDRSNSSTVRPSIEPRPSLTSIRTSSYLSTTESCFGNQNLANEYPLTFLVAEDNHINRKILVTMLSRLGYSGVHEAFDGRQAVRIMHDILESNATQYNLSQPADSLLTSTTTTTTAPVITTSPSSPSEGAEDCSPSSTVFSTTTATTATTATDPSSIAGESECTDSTNTCAQTAFCSQSVVTPSPPAKFIDIILMDIWMPDMDGCEAAEKIFEMVAEYRGRIANLSPNAVLPPWPTVLAVTADVTEEAIMMAKKAGMDSYLTKPYSLADLERLIVESCENQQAERA